MPGAVLWGEARGSIGYGGCSNYYFLRGSYSQSRGGCTHKEAGTKTVCVFREGGALQKELELLEKF